jgi:PIN domain nuclease of toxin-antitoxin system
VLDASALLALVNLEAGGEKVRPHLAGAAMSAVNYCETVYRLRRGGMPIEAVNAVLTPLIPQAVPFDQESAYLTASVHERTRELSEDRSE